MYVRRLLKRGIPLAVENIEDDNLPFGNGIINYVVRLYGKLTNGGQRPTNGFFSRIRNLALTVSVNVSAVVNPYESSR
jgi:hypothetical protein